MYTFGSSGLDLLAFVDGVRGGILLGFDLLKGRVTGGVRVKGWMPFEFATLAEEIVGVKGRMPVGSWVGISGRMPSGFVAAMVVCCLDGGRVLLRT